MAGIEIRPVAAHDERAWRHLWQGYLDFYQARIAEAQTQLTWQRLLDEAQPLHGLVAQAQGRLVGFTHSLLHGSTWSRHGYCYLEDLYVDASARGQGVARALIEATAEAAQRQGADKLYWLTQETNYSGRMLYDRLARRTGFIHYERPL